MNEQGKFEDGQIVKHKLTEERLLVLHHAAAGEFGGADWESVRCRKQDYTDQLLRPYELEAIEGE